ncbi:MAG: uracil-DNA glycosylase [Treponema sp.]|nr:uracil-DNA glycosylase [Treponema sp.]
MTAAEKTSVARFLDLAAAFAGSGYCGGENTYHFTDDPETGITVKDTPASEYAAGFDDSLEQVAADVRACTGCKLCKTRTNAVPGEGAPRPLVMVIGEGPGADEDASGRPFVGRAGQLLDKMLTAINLSRESNCFIANVIKCRPPANRDPQPDETAACSAFLARQIRLLKPRFILCAGRIAGHTLLNTTAPIGSLRGKFIDFQAGDAVIPFLATYHPSALLRNEDLKRPAWEDLKLLRSALDKELNN